MRTEYYNKRASLNQNQVRSIKYGRYLELKYIKSRRGFTRSESAEFEKLEKTISEWNKYNWGN